MPEAPPYPTSPCSVYGSNEYWLRKGWGPPAWVCKCCHLEPEEKQDGFLVDIYNDILDIAT